MAVPLLDLKAQYAKIREEILAAVGEVLESQRCIGGPKVAELEEKVAAVSDCKYAVGVSSGTDAILAVLMSLDIAAGDEVVTTPFTFFATAGCIARAGGALGCPQAVPRLNAAYPQGRRVLHRPRAVRRKLVWAVA